MSTKDLGKKVLDTIKKEKIKPKPRWEFLLKDYFVWSLFLVSVFIGSISVSVIIFIIEHENLFRFGPENPIKDIMTTIPYFWLLTLLLFIFLAYLNFKHTKTGYRFNILKVFLLSVVVSLLLGSLLYFLGISEKVEERTYDRLPLYRNMMDKRGAKMFSPEDGHLGGVIVRIEANRIELVSFGGKIWSVNLENINPEKKMFLELNSRIRFLGKIVGENEFEASDIMPWKKSSLVPKERLNYLDERNNLNMRIIR